MAINLQKLLMMKRFSYKISPLLLFYKTGPLLFILGVVCLFSACKKTEPVPAEPARIFKPGQVAVSSGISTATLKWSAPILSAGKKLSYTVDFSKDSLFSKVDFSGTSDTTGFVATDEQLQIRQTYFARIKANAFDNQPESKWFYSKSFQITGEQIFLPVQSSDVVDNAVVLKWAASQGITKITLMADGAAAVDYVVTADELTSGRKQIGNLKSNTKYTAEIYKGAKSVGILIFSTKSPLAGNIIDLRNITDRPSVLSDTLGIIPSGSTVLLKRGLTYTLSAILSLDRSVTILSGDDLSNPAQAIISMPSNFNLTAGSIIDFITFKDVTLRGTDYTSKYIFNTTNAATVGKISFDGCRAQIFRGLIRLQSGAMTLGALSITNSIIDSLGSYGVITIDNVSCRVNDITVSNSTIYKADRFIVSKQSSNSINLLNCTFNEVPLGGGSNYLIDYTASLSVTSGITINNCILGPGKISGTSVVVRGVRASTTTAVTSSNTYVTSDYSAASNAIPGLIVYSGTAAALWNKPFSGDFKIKDTSFAGLATAGDPRWR